MTGVAKEELCLQFRERLMRAGSLRDFISQSFDHIYYHVVREMDLQSRNSLALTMVDNVCNVSFSHTPGGSCQLRSFWLDDCLVCCDSQRPLIDGRDHLAVYAAIGLAAELWNFSHQVTRYHEAWYEFEHQRIGNWEHWV